MIISANKVPPAECKDAPFWFVRCKDDGWYEDEEDDDDSQNDAQMSQTNAEWLHASRDQFVHKILEMKKVVFTKGSLFRRVDRSKIVANQ